MSDVIDGEATEILPEADLPVVASPAGTSTALVARDEINVSELVGQSNVIKEAMRAAMTPGIHYGTIPGVDKPTLLKPGAEKLLVLFRLAPAYESDKIWHDDGHLTVSVKCILHHIPTGLKVAEGEGLCTTKESRYAWRKGGRICPVCNQPSIIKGKAEYGGGWLCFAKKGGCGAKWEDGTLEANEFENANLDRVANPDLPDSYNTVLKMADKRALLAAILNGTAASDVFTQDMEDASATTASGAPEPPDEPVVQRPWSPALDLRADAPTARQGWKGINALFAEVDPSIEWPEVMRQAIAGVYGDDFVLKDAEQPVKDEVFHRTANAAGRLSELFSGETFLSVDHIQKAFAEMFEGVVVDIPVFTPEGFVPESAEEKDVVLEAEVEDDPTEPITDQGAGHTGTAAPNE